jgi:hypothetical protein
MNVIYEVLATEPASPDGLRKAGAVSKTVCHNLLRALDEHPPAIRVRQVSYVDVPYVLYLTEPH